MRFFSHFERSEAKSRHKEAVIKYIEENCPLELCTSFRVSTPHCYVFPWGRLAVEMTQTSTFIMYKLYNDIKEYKNPRDNFISRGSCKYKCISSKIECQWWLDGERRYFATTDPKQWNFRFLIRTPDFVKDKELDAAVETLLKNGKEPEVRQVKVESFSEDLCVQMLHIRPYENEPETILPMEVFAGQQDMEFHG